MSGVRLRNSTALIVFVAGCSAPRGIDIVEVAAQPGAPSASVSASVLDRRTETGAHLCATFRREQNALIEAALAGPVSPSDPLDSDSAREALTKLGNHCWPGKKSAWATKLDWVAPRPWDGYQGLTARVALVHLGADGQRGMVVPPPSLAGGPEGVATNAYFSSLDAGGVENATAFDFDGDGDDELVLVLGGSYHEGESWSVGRVWTSKNGAVTEYPPAAGMLFLEARDVDKDGRPDLVDFGAYTSVLEGCCSGFSHRVAGPSLIAHSTKGGAFSANDAVALRIAREACPSAPKPVIAKGEPWDEGQILRGVACGRLWGREPAEIAQEIAAATPIGMNTCDQSTCADRTEVAAFAATWSSYEPPLRLK